MIDFTKLKKLTIGGVELKQLFINGIQVWKAITFTNLLPTSIDTDGSIYNKVGYKNNSRMNSSAAVVTLDGYTVTGYIPARAGNTVRVKGVTFDSAHNTGCYFWTFDSSFKRLKYEKPDDSNSSDISITQEGNGVTAFHLVYYNTNVRYIRFSAYGDGANAIVTVDEEIA